MSTSQWEDAFLAQSQDAAIGRLFRGIIHNLNGVIQVFSLQSDLHGMMLSKALTSIDQLRQSGPSPQLEDLYELIAKRIDSLNQMQDKVRQSQLLLRRTLILPDFKAELGSLSAHTKKLMPPGYKAELGSSPVQAKFMPEAPPQVIGAQRYTINSILETEVEFLAADPCFKHKVEKKLLPLDEAPPLTRCQLELHQIVHFLLQNALDAVQALANPQIQISASRQEEGIVVSIEDNGPGLAQEALQQLYQPFFTTKEGHAGLGLYLANKLALRCGGRIICESRPGSTRFQLILPKECAG